MADIEETIGTESHFVENNSGIKTLLCLTNSDDVDGNPISTTESLRRHLPTRVFGRLEYIDEDMSHFAISLISDPRNFAEFKFNINRHYADPINREVVSTEDRDPNGLYVCRMGREFYRCRILDFKKRTNICTVFLIDVGAEREVVGEDIYTIDFGFHGEQHYNYAFALRCSLPSEDCLKELGLPMLDELTVGEILDVVICSLHEPCLAVIGSTRKHFSRIYPESFIVGLEELTASIWQSNFINATPSFSGITAGQYPPAQPTLSNYWMLTTVAGFNSLVSVYIRDISCSVRLSVLQEILNDFYMDEKCRTQMAFDTTTPLSRDLPCVVFDELSMQYFRGRVVHLSGDRTLADVACVDYPSVTFKSVDRRKLFMLSERFFIPPQCFSVQLVDEDEAVGVNIHDYTNIARHFVEVGSVVSIFLSPKSTVAIMKVADGNILDKIDFKMKDKGKAPFPKYAPSPVRNPFIASIITGAQITATARGKVPMGSTTIFIATIRNANEIFYRKRAEANAFGQMNSKLIKLKQSGELIPFSENSLKNVRVTKMYIISCQPSYEFRRILVTQNDIQNGGEIRYVRIDDGEKGTFYPDVDALFDIPFDLERIKPAIIGPHCLAKPENNVIDAAILDKYADDLRLVTNLRTLIPTDCSCLAIERAAPTPLYSPHFSVTRRSPSSAAALAVAASSSSADGGDGHSAKVELMLYRRNDCSCINEEYFELAAKIIQTDEREKSWQVNENV